MALEVFDVDGSDSAGNEDLHLIMVEHTQPLDVEDISQALAEGRAVGAHLFATTVIINDSCLLSGMYRILRGEGGQLSQPLVYHATM